MDKEIPIVQFRVTVTQKDGEPVILLEIGPDQFLFSIEAAIELRKELTQHTTQFTKAPGMDPNLFFSLFSG